MKTGTPIVEMVVSSALVLCFVGGFAGRLSAQDGAALYKDSCATCHDTGVERAPTREALRAMSPERVLDVMEAGAMISMASRLSGSGRRAIAEFVTGKSFSSEPTTTPSTQD